MEIPYKDAKYVVAAVVLAATLYIVSLGFAWGWYIAIVYLTLNTTIAILAAGIMLNPDVFPPTAKYKNQAHRNHGMQFLVQLITAVCLYQMNLSGFVFISGFFSFLLLMSVCSNIMTALAKPKG